MCMFFFNLYLYLHKNFLISLKLSLFINWERFIIKQVLHLILSIDNKIWNRN